GPDGRLPVTIRYADRPDAAALEGRAAALPGVTVLSARPADGQVDVAVPARRAAEFWAALTEPAVAGATPRLAGGAAEGRLTGHRMAADPTPHAGGPWCTVSIRITSPTTGPVWNGGTRCGTVPKEEDPPFRALAAVRFCPSPAFGAGVLWGLAGAGKGTTSQTATEPTCVGTTPAEPLPICAEWQLTFQVPAGIYAAWSQGVVLTEDNPDHTLEIAQVLLDVPQFTVTGDTTIRLDAGRAVPVTVDTPEQDAVYTDRT